MFQGTPFWKFLWNSKSTPPLHSKKFSDVSQSRRQIRRGMCGQSQQSREIPFVGLSGREGVGRERERRRSLLKSEKVERKNQDGSGENFGK